MHRFGRGLQKAILTRCPSYMVTLEEEHSTRGRAHMLFELLQGEIVKGGWQDEQVKESLDLCLACKACKSECPANVDIATYKAEFLAHCYESYRRPLFALVVGRMDKWLRAASLAPRAANFLSHAPGFSHILRTALRLAPEREIPALAPAISAVGAKSRKIRERGTAGRRPRSYLVGGYFQQLLSSWNSPGGDRCPHARRIRGDDSANAIMRKSSTISACSTMLNNYHRAAEIFARPIDAGTPIVVLEPSCASVFRDELQNLFPDHPRAAQLHRPDVSSEQNSSNVMLPPTYLRAFRERSSVTRPLSSESPLENDAHRIAASQNGSRSTLD